MRKDLSEIQANYRDIVMEKTNRMIKIDSNIKEQEIYLQKMDQMISDQLILINEL